MASHAHSTRLRAVVPHLPRAALEDLIERSLELLDTMDGDADFEPDYDGEAEPSEESAQLATLCPNVVPLRRGGAFRAPGAPKPPSPPRMPLLPWPNRPPGIDPAKEPNEAAAVLS